MAASTIMVRVRHGSRNSMRQLEKQLRNTQGLAHRPSIAVNGVQSCARRADLTLHARKEFHQRRARAWSSQPPPGFANFRGRGIEQLVDMSSGFETWSGKEVGYQLLLTDNKSSRRTHSREKSKYRSSSHQSSKGTRAKWAASSQIQPKSSPSKSTAMLLSVACYFAIDPMVN